MSMHYTSSLPGSNDQSAGVTTGPRTSGTSRRRADAGCCGRGPRGGPTAHGGHGGRAGRRRQLARLEVSVHGTGTCAANGSPPQDRRWEAGRKREDRRETQAHGREADLTGPWAKRWEAGPDGPWARRWEAGRIEPPIGPSEATRAVAAQPGTTASTASVQIIGLPPPQSTH
jgi:hypothetical protein